MATKQDMSDRKDAMLGGWDTAVLVTAQRLARFAYDGQVPAWSELNELIEPHLSAHTPSATLLASFFLRVHGSGDVKLRGEPFLRSHHVRGAREQHGLPYALWLFYDTHTRPPRAPPPAVAIPASTGSMCHGFLRGRQRFPSAGAREALSSSQD